MKKLCLAVCVLAATFQSQAALDLYDSFNYSPTGVQLGNVTSPGWVAYVGGGVHPTNFAGSLSYPGLQTASGDNSVQYNGAGAAGVAARNLSQVYNINNASTLYYSLTFKVTSISAADWGNTSVNFLNGSFMMGFNQKLQNGTTLAQGDVGAALLIRTGDPNNVSGTANDFQGYQLGAGVTAVSPGARIFDSTHVYLPNDTLFLVMSYTFGAGASDDVVKLYVDPTPGSLEGANIPVVTTTGQTDIANNQISSFFLRNNSVEPTNTQIDDLRIGTTWADVTPAAVPEPSAGAVAGMGILAFALIRRLRR